MLKFNDTTAVRRLIQVQALEPFQLQLSGDDDLHRLDPAKLTSADQSLLDAKGSGIVFVDDENAQTLSVALAAKAPQFDAEIHSQVLVTDNRLIESYRFTISPSGRELRRFRPPEPGNAGRYFDDICMGHQGKFLLTIKWYLLGGVVLLILHSDRHAIPEEPILPGAIHVLHHIAADREHHPRIKLAAFQDLLETLARVRQ
jgi:hypothetical protein